MSIRNLLLTGHMKRNLFFDTACILLLAAFCAMCIFAGRQKEELEITGEPGAFMEEIDLSGYKLRNIPGYVSMEESCLFSDECLSVSSVSKRVSRIFFVLQFNGLCSGEDLMLTFRFDNGKEEECRLNAFVGGQGYQLSIPFPKEAEKWRLEGISCRQVEHSLSACMHFGDDRKLLLKGVNTLKHKGSCCVLLYNREGIVLDYLELKGSGTEVVSPGVSYYRYLF